MKRMYWKLLGVQCGLMLAAVSSAYAQGAKVTPPAEPSVKPQIYAPKDVDPDGDKIDNKLSARAAKARAVISKRDAAPAEKTAAQSTLDKDVIIECVFDRQITQAQIDAFEKNGGKFDRVFQAVSYGWTGRIPLKNVDALKAALGGSLVGIVEEKATELFMDQAGQNSRVRPAVWNAGVDGNQSATANKITIGIIDSGVDGTHTDLSGRQEYWMDTTTDAHGSPQDVGHHGSHVAGIATGTGASAGVSPATISYMDLNVLPGVGSFFPSPIHVPTAQGSVNWSGSMAWDTGGAGTAQLGYLVWDPSIPSWALFSSNTNTASPVTHSVTGFLNPPGGPYINRYTGFATWNVLGAGTRNYAVTNTVAYAGVGDGYNVFRGVAPDCKWAGWKVFQDNGAGNTTDIDEALDDVVVQRSAESVKVINMSLGVVGTPGINITTRAKVNTAATNGVVCVIAAGNDGANAGLAGSVDDPGLAQYCITVAATSDINSVTSYSNHGSGVLDVANGGGDQKPDICGPGGSQNFQSNIMSIDSNTADRTRTTYSNITDQVANNYYNIQGTSMAAPHIAGVAALIIDAMQTAGETWDFTGGNALADVMRVKMLMLATATETQSRESGSGGSTPALNRGAKDLDEGYGIVNADAAVEAYTNSPIGPALSSPSDTLGVAPYGKRCWARRINMISGSTVTASVTAGDGNDDLDLYLYNITPDSFGNPVIIASSVTAGTGGESINVAAPYTGVGLLVVKAVSVVAPSAPFMMNVQAPVSVSEYIVE